MEHTQHLCTIMQKSDRASYAVCTVEANEADASPYKRTLKSVSGKKYVTTHEYQIKGLVPGAKNKITMQFFNEDGRAVGKNTFLRDSTER